MQARVGNVGLTLVHHTRSSHSLILAIAGRSQSEQRAILLLGVCGWRQESVGDRPATNSPAPPRQSGLTHAPKYPHLNGRQYRQTVFDTPGESPTVSGTPGESTPSVSKHSTATSHWWTTFFHLLWLVWLFRVGTLPYGASRSIHQLWSRPSRQKWMVSPPFRRF